MKIFIGTMEIAGYGHYLEQGLRDIGVNVRSWYEHPHKFQYQEPKKQKYWFKFVSNIENMKDGRLKQVFLRLKELLKFFIFIYFMFTRDTFIIIYGWTFLKSKKDLAIMKFFRKKIIMLFCGSDIRCTMIDASVFDRKKLNEKRINNKIQRVRIYEKYADVIIAEPLYSQLLRRKIINRFFVGIPCGDDEELFYISENTNKSSLEKIRVIHAPSNPKVKGTDRIREAIQELSKEFDLEYTEIIGMPNIEVIKAIKECDLVIDQLYTDIPLAGLATEAARLGKPSVVGTYGKDSIIKYYRMKNQLCFLIHPNTLKCELRAIFNDRSTIEKVGKHVKHFVSDEWDRQKVARRFVSIIQGKIDKSWFFDPQDIDYWQGHGLTEKEIQEFLQKINLDDIDLPKDSKYLCSLKQLKKNDNQEVIFCTTIG